MQTIVYPLYDRNNRISLNLPEAIAACANNAQSGTFLVGKNHHWHGGIHLSHPSGSVFSDIVLQSIAKGKVVAYRLNEDWEHEEYSGKQLQYSRNFILIQHDLESAYYNNGYNEEKLFQGYRFYSLFMHVAPANVLQANEALPWFLSTTRQNLTGDQIIARNSPVTLLTKEGNPAGDADTPLTLAFNGLVHVQFTSEGIPSDKRWIPIGKIAFDKIANQYVTAQPIKYFYTENKETLDSSVLNKVVSLKPRNQILIETGDMLGMLGGTVVGEDFKGQLIHFEIFADNIDFLENIIQRASTSTSSAHTLLNMASNYSIAAYLKSKRITGQHHFAAGRFYYKPATPSSATTSSNWEEYYYINADSLMHTLSQCASYEVAALP